MYTRFLWDAPVVWVWQLNSTLWRPVEHKKKMCHTYRSPSGAFGSNKGHKYWNGMWRMFYLPLNVQWRKLECMSHISLSQCWCVDRCPGSSHQGFHNKCVLPHSCRDPLNAINSHSQVARKSDIMYVSPVTCSKYESAYERSFFYTNVGKQNLMTWQKQY